MCLYVLENQLNSLASCELCEYSPQTPFTWLSKTGLLLLSFNLECNTFVSVFFFIQTT